jgi:hypothetical protein
VRSRAVLAGVVGIVTVAIAAATFVALRSSDNHTQTPPTDGAKSVALGSLTERDALIAVDNADDLQKFQDALDASPKVTSYAQLRPGAAAEIMPSGTSTQVQCDAGGFIVDLAPSVDPNEFASTLPSGAEVSDWQKVVSGPAYNAQIFDLVATSPYVLVTLTPAVTPKQIETIGTAPTVVGAHEITEAEYLATFPEAQRATVPRPIPRVLELQLKPGIPVSDASAAIARFPGVADATGRELSCDAAANSSRSG